MDVSSRSLWRKSYLLPSVLCSHCSGIVPFRWVTRRTVRMASLSSSAAQSAAIPDAAASSSAATHGAPSSSAATDAAASSSSEASASSAIDFLSLCHRLKTTKRAGWVRKGVQEPESVADHMYRMSVMALIADYSPDIDRERCIKMALVHDIAEAIVGDITPSDGVPKDEKSRREREAINHMCNLLGGGSRVAVAGGCRWWSPMTKAVIIGGWRPVVVVADGQQWLADGSLLVEGFGGGLPAVVVGGGSLASDRRQWWLTAGGDDDWQWQPTIGGGLGRRAATTVVAGGYWWRWWLMARAKEMLELWMEYEENSSLEAKVVKDFDKVEMILQALEYEQEQGMNLDEFFQSTAGKFQTDVGKAWALEITSRRRKKQE
ncbi:hypothetical protein IEQ34_018060 [Dendrobium chrysotoxum]|uniref:5'-deoxynucleotidase n=1 Tax=Dendrobium chrysotoxum TaxID=161865 RepID=A0AAV7GBA9_DENCH|nr:hypothetical protein IEQ34_018060 [Dendrobium chrysotoxum]